MIKDTLLKAYEFNLKYAHQLVDDVDDEMMTFSPGPGLENHPAFTLGHLISAAALTSKYLGGPYNFDPEWEELFRRKGPGDPRRPSPEVERYPSRSVLLNELTAQHKLVVSLLKDLDESRWEEVAKWRFDSYMPTLGGVLHFMCVTHEAMHLSQLAAWRRAVGLPSALGAM